jgi:hypothetical protein
MITARYKIKFLTPIIPPRVQNKKAERRNDFILCWNYHFASSKLV